MFNERELLLPYQRAWLDETAQVAVIEKGRRAGVSWAQAGDDASYAIGKSGGNVWYMGQDKDMSLAYITDVAWWASEVYGALNPHIQEDIWEDGKERVLAYSVKFASGFKCTALSSRPANLRSKGRPGDRFTFDEVAFHPDFEGLLKAAGALLMWGCRIRMISTHNGAGNPFNLLIEDIRAGKKPGAVHRVTFNEAVEQGVYRRICKISEQTWTPEKEAAWVAEIRAFYGDNAAEELDVIPSAGSGVWLTRALIEARMVECERVEIGA